MQIFRSNMVFALVLSMLGNVVAQSSQPANGIKASYPIGPRIVISTSPCSEVEWKNYAQQLNYAQITLQISYCQQFNDYLVNTNKTEPKKSRRGWGSSSAKARKVAAQDDDIFLGTHFEKISEQEIFVLTLAEKQDSADDIEKELELQCRDWVSLLPNITDDAHTPDECR